MKCFVNKKERHSIEHPGKIDLKFGVFQSLQIQGSHLSENIELQSFQIAFLLRLLSLRQAQIKLLGGHQSLRFLRFVDF